MRFSSRTWAVISALCFLAALGFWEYGNRRIAESKARAATNSPAASGPAPTGIPTASTNSPAGVPPAPRSGLAAIAGSLALTSTDAALFPYRLRNTPLGIAELTRRESAVLLASALIDTAAGAPPQVPAHLHADRDAGSYVVQARGRADAAFRAQLRESGAETIAYIPNNAYLVRAEPAGLARLETAPRVQAVLTYEPYYKLESALLEPAINRQPLAPGTWLGLTLFARDREAALDALAGMGVDVKAEERTPFGPRLVVAPPDGPESLAALARLPQVQTVERFLRRALANDLTRVRLGVSEDTVVSNSYLDLTGSNVLISINDTGVDATHPDLKGRVFSTDTNATTLVDFDGHGTHVAGTLVSSGGKSSTVTNAFGSATSANFRGVVPRAKLFVLPLDLQTGPLVSDTYLIQTAARTNALISNNSWGYLGANEYNTAAANFDAAVRDALPEQPGDQPLLFVFAAGNEGEGDDNGVGGVPNTVRSPGSAKNVITVGSIEAFRQVTNSVILTNVVEQAGESITNVSTNFFFLAMTDSDNEVANSSSRGNVGIGVEGQFGRFKPDVVSPGSFLVSTRSAQWTLQTNTPDYEVLTNLNAGLGPFYRYESGTSMAAPGISGLLALIQEFFEQRLKRTNSPALMKAMLINGARSVNSRYDLHPGGPINYQGWGLANLARSLPVALTNAAAEAAWPMRLIDQSPTNALATGQSHSYRVRLSPDARNFGLRATLVWTDPPGNPGAAVKLVNDLDLLVTNLDTGEFYYGNDIATGSDFNTLNVTNSATGPDVINNVENVFLREPLGTNYSITVVGRRVNVNAVTANTTDVVQDYALVVSSENAELTQPFEQFERQVPPVSLKLVSVLTNGVVLLNQTAGANFPLTGNRLGETNQWSFYVFTNVFESTSLAAITNGSNVAFLTFLPPNLARPRALEGDIDLYVSTDAALTNLDAGALAGAFKSVGRGGSQLVFFTNAPIGSVYYVGVKAEDQQAVEFGLVGLSSDLPFDFDDAQGNRVIRGMPVVVPIPDGSPSRPGVAYMFGIGTRPVRIAHLSVSDQIVHEAIGDLSGNLSHNDRFVVLNNHFSDINYGLGGTNFLFNYDDSNGGRFGLGSKRTDGPGSLNDFLGEESSGVWTLTMVDSALTHVGRVGGLFIRVTPLQRNPTGIQGELLANRSDFYVTDVPIDAISMTVTLVDMTGPLDLYIRRGQPPTHANFDKFAQLAPPTNSVTITPRDIPPLAAGRYYIEVFNPTAATVSYRINVQVELALRVDANAGYNSIDTPMALPDDALVTSTLFASQNREILETRVGVRIDHPRVADLVLHLVSPQGTRLLLAENRGGLTPDGYGGGTLSNLVFAGFTDATNLTETPIKFALPPFSAPATTTNFLLSGFEGLAPQSFKRGDVFDGWEVRDLAAITNEPGRFFAPTIVAGGAYAGANYLSVGNARVGRDIPTIPGRSYTLRFAYRAAPGAAVLGQFLFDGVLDRFFTAHATEWGILTRSFIAASDHVTIDVAPGQSVAGLWVDDFELVETGGIVYYQPEEPLKPLEGQSALGNWRLEVWDNRAGPAGSAAELLYWQLQFILAPPNPPVVRLTNGVPYFGTVTTNDIQYFIVDVPRDAYAATNFLFSLGDVVLLYSPSGRPTGKFPDDIVVDAAGAGSTEGLLLQTNRPPLLVPGQQYYLGVANFDRNETNRFVILVDLATAGFDLLGLPVLTNGVTVTNTIAATNTIDYYRFTVAPGGYQATFSLRPLDGNVDLLLRKATPVSDPLPTTGTFDYISTALGTNLDEIVVTTNSIPVPMQPGDWLVGVYNNDTNKVTYTLTATQLVGPRVIPLTDGVPLRMSELRGASFSNYFQFALDDTNVSARFDLYDFGPGDAGFYLGKDGLFQTNTALFGAISTNRQPQRFFVPAPPIVDPVGNYYAAVAVQTGTNIDYTVRATLFTNGVTSVAALPTDGSISTNVLFGLPGLTNVEYFHYTVATNAKYVDVELKPLSGNLDLFLKHDLPLPSTNLYDHAGTQPGLATEFVRLIRGDALNPLLPGDYYLAVVNRELFPAKYTLRVREVPGGEPIPLSENQPYANYALTNELDSYRVDVPADALGAFFVLTATDPGVTNQLQLLLNQGLPVPTPATFNVGGYPDAPGQTFLVVKTTSAPVPLTPGDWYLSVVNSGTNAVNYEVSYFLDHSKRSATNVIKPDLTLTNSGICLTWPSVAGTAYDIQGKTNWVPPFWTPGIASVAATGPTALACLPLSQPYRYFEVLPGGGGTPPIIDTNVVILPGLTISNGLLVIAWQSVAGADYRVEGKTNVAGAAWVPVSPVIRATGPVTRYAVSLSAGLGFYRVVSLGGGTTPPPVGDIVVGSRVDATNHTFCLSWTAVAGAQYRVDAKTDLSGTNWIAVTTVTAAGTSASYCAPLGSSLNFYRVVAVSGGTPPPTGGAEIPVTPRFDTASGDVCLTFTTVAGRTYRLEGKSDLADPAWHPVGTTLVATGASSQFCAAPTNAVSFLRVVEAGTGSTGGGGGASTPPEFKPALVQTDGKLALSWTATSGKRYELQGSSDLTTWTTIQTLTATSATAAFAVTPAPAGFAFYRVRELP